MRVRPLAFALACVQLKGEGNKADTILDFAVRTLLAKGGQTAAHCRKPTPCLSDCTAGVDFSSMAQQLKGLGRDIADAKALCTAGQVSSLAP